MCLVWAFLRKIGFDQGDLFIVNLLIFRFGLIQLFQLFLQGKNAPLNTFDWLAGVPGNEEYTDIVEVQLKNTRKGYYKNSNNLPLKKGDVVAVEATPGHDIGTVTMTGRLVLLQLKKTRLYCGICYSESYDIHYIVGIFIWI